MRTYWLIPGLTLLLLGAGCALSKSQTNQAVQDVALAEPASAKSLVAPQVVAAAVALSPELPPGEPQSPRVVTLSGGEFFFDPASISAKAGEELTVSFGTVTGHHIFTIDELDIAKEMTPGGSVTFTAPTTPGRYTYYCSVGPHRTLGMTGTLIVE